MLPEPVREPARRLFRQIRNAWHVIRKTSYAVRTRVTRARYSPSARRFWPGIKPLRTWEISSLRERDPYYRGREGYLGQAAAIAGELIKRDRLVTGLELGPNLRPILYGADVMDRRLQPGIELEGRLILHNASVTPWPVADDAYGLFIALQVFEHLGTDQPAAFREVARVARHAILSLPIDWDLEDTTNLHHGLTHERVLSWFEPWTPTRVVEGNPGKRKRLIYVFEDLRPR